MPSRAAPDEPRRLVALPVPTGVDPPGADEAFRHDASLHRGRKELLAASADFVRTGLESGEPVMACAPADVLTRLARELPSAGKQLTLVDHGRFPSRTVAQWISFADRCHASGQAA